MIKSIVITGASSGLGKELAKIALKNKCKVVNVANEKCDLKGVVNILCDLTDEKQIDKAANEIIKKYSKFDVLVNNAGVASEQAQNAIEYKEIERVMRVNAFAPIYFTSKLLDLIKANEADIVNVGSTIILGGYSEMSVYGASKWANRGVSIHQRLELIKTKCRVVHFNPSAMATDIWDRVNGTKAEDLRKRKWADPADMAACLWDIINLPKSLEVVEVNVKIKKN